VLETALSSYSTLATRSPDSTYSASQPSNPIFGVHPEAFQVLLAPGFHRLHYVCLSLIIGRLVPVNCLHLVRRLHRWHLHCLLLCDCNAVVAQLVLLLPPPPLLLLELVDVGHGVRDAVDLVREVSAVVIAGAGGAAARTNRLGMEVVAGARRRADCSSLKGCSDGMFLVQSGYKAKNDDGVAPIDRESKE
jgi:hypothetical protein